MGARTHPWVVALAVLAACGRVGFDQRLTSGDGGVDSPPPDAAIDANGAHDASADASDPPDAIVSEDGGGSTWLVTALSAGAEHTCAITSGEARCWGHNGGGRLGDGTTTNRAIPDRVVGLPVPVTEISAGSTHTCAIADGRVYCFGTGTSGELGDGAMRDSATPVMPSGLPSPMSHVSAGTQHTCASSGDRVWCWGRNHSGQLGDGTTTPSPTPREITFAFGGAIDELTASDDHSCARAGALAYCWGHNDNGALGAGLTASSASTPQTVLLDGIATLSLAGWHACAIAGGAAFCWGTGDRGELGDGRMMHSNVPIAVPALSGGVTSLSANGGPIDGDATCAIRDGVIYCWGRNTNGRLGDGTTVDAAAPVPVVGGTGARIVAAGHFHACAVFAPDAIRCWGRGTAGQLGHGEVTNSAVPVDIVSWF